MTLNDISLLRLANQQISATKFEAANDIVGWMGAMQAQDYAMAKWAVGVRLPNSTDKKIEMAVAKGEIIRTHVLRPTWHFVSPAHIYWMLELTAPHILSSMRSRHKQLEITDAVVTKSNSVIERILRNGKHLTRDEIFEKLEQGKIATSNQRGIHLLMRAELDRIICSGIPKEKEQTYALLSERVTKKKTLNRNEALAKLAKKYFTSHGPATLQDFIWWSGLPVSDARSALEMVKQNFIPEKIDSQTYWFTDSMPVPKTKKESVYLLPAYDEFIISYKDRSAALTSEHHKKTISDNGMFWPVIVVNGRVVGTWKRSIKKEVVIVEAKFFHAIEKSVKSLIQKTFERFGDFLELKTEIVL